MKYYIFKVDDGIEEYYILNNKYIGYIGFDSQYVRAVLEKKIKRKYQLFATSSETDDKYLHESNCGDLRFTYSGVLDLINNFPIFRLSSDKSWYKIFFPNKNCSDCYLKEAGGEKTIKDL